MRWRTAVAIVIVLLVAACGDDTPTAGTVTIETEGDLIADDPAGSFEVTEGAEILGCSSGSWVTTDVTRLFPGVEVTRLFTCESGSKTGTFTLSFVPESAGALWTMVEGTEDFEGLQGGGDMSLSTTTSETITGDIEFLP